MSTEDSSSSSSSLSRADLFKRGSLLAAASSFLLTGRRPAWAAAEEEGAAPPTPPPPPTPTGPVKTAYDYEVPYDGVRVPLSKFKGKAVVVCNAKTDDPESLNQIPGMAYLNNKFGALSVHLPTRPPTLPISLTLSLSSFIKGKSGLKVWLFTTEQGTFETDEDRVIRIKYYQQYGYGTYHPPTHSTIDSSTSFQPPRSPLPTHPIGQYPNSLVFDKIDIVGKRADPFFKVRTSRAYNNRLVFLHSPTHPPTNSTSAKPSRIPTKSSGLP